MNRDHIEASRPEGFTLPALSELEKALKKSVEECKDLMVQTIVTFEDDLKKSKDDKKLNGDGDGSGEEDESDDN